MKPKFLISAVLSLCVAAAFVIFGKCGQGNASAPHNTPAPYVVNPLDLLPADDEVPGWIAGENTDCFPSGKGVAYNVNDLFDLFDGPGEPFRQNGFVNAVFGVYLDAKTIGTDSTVPLCLQIFNQSTHVNALEIFKIQAYTTPYEIISNLGDTARLDPALTNIGLEIVYNRYYIRLIVQKRSPATDPIYEQALFDFGAVIVRRINAALKT